MMRARFTLYITGHTPRSERAIRNARELLEEYYGDRFEFSVMDTLESPGEAFTERIVATPVLIRAFPHPRGRLVGDLSDTSTARHWLESADVLEEEEE